MIIYKYSIIREIKLAIRNYWRKKDLTKKGIIFIDFSLWNFTKLYFLFRFGKMRLPQVGYIKDNVICYVVSSGTWGAYELPNKIFICPLELEKLPMSLEELILHEFVHLKLEKNTVGKSFEEKEIMIDEKVKEILAGKNNKDFS